MTKRIFYSPIGFNQNEKYNLLGYDNTISFNEKNMAIVINLPDTLLRKAEKNIILEFCLAVAVCEAYGGDELSFPVDHILNNKNIIKKNKFFFYLKQLAKEASLRKVKVDFLSELKFELNNDNSIENWNITQEDKPLLIFSGGLDCTVASYYLTSQKIYQSYLFFDYGQNNIKEESYCVNQQIIKQNINKDKFIFEKSLKEFFFNLKFSINLINQKKITSNNKRAEYVPFRNSVFIALALSYCNEYDLNTIVTGSQLDDRISPDNSPSFYSIYNNLLKTYRPTNGIKICPVLFNFGGKKEVVKLGESLRLDFSRVWTCHNPSQNENKLMQCGECGDCITRKNAFEENGLVDPIPYMDVEK